MFEQSAVVTVGGLVTLIAFVTAAFKAVGWFRGIVDKAVSDLKDQHEKDLTMIHERIDRANAEVKEVRIEYVRRVDLDAHLRNIEKKIDDFVKRFDDFVKLELSSRRSGNQP